MTTPFNMRKYLLFLSFFSLFSSCSPESTSETDEPEKEKTFEVDLITDSYQLEVDKMAVITVDSELPLYEVSQIWEDGERSLSAGNPGENLLSDLKLYFRFSGTGTKNIHLEFTSVDGITVTKDLEFQVSRGQTVRIMKVVVNSFYNIDETWDPEFAETDEERLADVVFAFEKLQHFNFTKNELSMGGFHLSDVRENQEDLVWDLSGQELYLDPLNQLNFGLADVDDGNLAQNLLLDYPSKNIRLRDYLDTRPESISLTDETIDLDVTIYLEWP